MFRLFVILTIGLPVTLFVAALALFFVLYPLGLVYSALFY